MQKWNTVRKLALGGAVLALVASSSHAQVIEKTTRVEKRTEVTSNGDALELTGKVELFADAGEEEITIVDDSGVRYFVMEDENIQDLRPLVGKRIKINYFTPPKRENVVKIRSFQPLLDGDGEIEIERDGNEVEVDVDD